MEALEREPVIGDSVHNVVRYADGLLSDARIEARTLDEKRLYRIPVRSADWKPRLTNKSKNLQRLSETNVSDSLFLDFMLKCRLNE
ncbi:hypothetical protein C7N83_00820 [Neisseria iguanae]|uniref:Uncharacterized protein n=1 Tax=Neisseria iguanae TaxID=90242 RepID=A0A2P7U341_9NEIS|nr:hypothetical protein C7N83_00820 [Neisseria iguanae]